MSDPAEAKFVGIGKLPLTLIRAPYITSVGAEVQVLSAVDERIVAARQGNRLVTAFHPELYDDMRVQRYFLEMVHTDLL